MNIEIIEIISINTPSDVIWLKGICARVFEHIHETKRDYLTRAAIELANNQIRYAGSGHILFVKALQEPFFIAADYGPGIVNIPLAFTRGFSTFPDSLGLGLYMITQHDEFKPFIITNHSHNTIHTGTIVILLPITFLHETWASFSLALDFEQKNGDFCFSKQNILFFGDIAGHGISTEPTKQHLETFFYHYKLFSDAKRFFADVHTELTLHSLRAIAGALMYIGSASIGYWSVGNILSFVLPTGLLLHQKEGMAGNAYHAVSYDELEKTDTPKMLYVTSDGINETSIRDKTVFRLLHEIENPVVGAIALTHFARRLNDDATTLCVRIPQKETTHASVID